MCGLTARVSSASTGILPLMVRFGFPLRSSCPFLQRPLITPRSITNGAHDTHQTRVLRLDNPLFAATPLSEQWAVQQQCPEPILMRTWETNMRRKTYKSRRRKRFIRVGERILRIS